jgi:hypothetical protein
MAGNLGATVQDLINEAAGILGIFQSGDPLAASDLASFYFTLGMIVDSWGAERLTILSTAILPFTTIAGKQSYNTGPAAAGIDWVVTPLPPAFNGAGMMTGTLEIPIDIGTTSAEWRAIGLKSLQSGIIENIWPDLGTASHTLNLWPVPNAAIPILLYVPLQVPAFTSTSNTLLLEPGYLQALVYELAITAASKFGAAIPEWLPEAWSLAKSRIKEASFEALDAQCDPAIVSSGPAGGGSINFYMGR